MWQDQRRKAKEASLSCARRNNGNIGHRQPKNSPAKLKHSADEIKPEQRDIAKVNKTETISQQVNGPGHGTLTNLHDVKRNLTNKIEVTKDQRTDAVKEASHGDTDRLAKDGVSAVENKNVTVTSPEQDQNLPSPKKRDSEMINNKMSSPGKRDLLSSVDNEVKKDVQRVISGVNSELKKSSVKHKHVLTDEERATRQRLHKSLQNLKPQLSSHKHHPVATCTPVIFHEVICRLNEKSKNKNLILKRTG